MSDWGRIRRDFHRHMKVIKLIENDGLDAIALWTLCNSWSRDNRKHGFIPFDCPVLTQIDPTYDLAGDLVSVELWEKVDGGFKYHDHDEHNADIQPGTTAARLVRDVLGDRFPGAVRTQLSGKVAELLQEGQEVAPIKAALKVWGDRPGANASLLPYLVADAIREDTSGDLKQAIRTSWATNDVTPLRKFGFWFRPPVAPREIDNPEDMLRFMRNAQKDWLRGLMESV